MYGQYVAAVFRRAFQPAKGAVEWALLLAAIVSSMLAWFAGIDVQTGNSLLAYIGVAVVAYLAIRIFFVAPYQVWKEQVGQIGSLRTELDEPERKELAHMAIIRAGKRLDLAAALREYHWASFHAHENYNEVYLKVITLMGQAGATEGFLSAWVCFAQNCKKVRVAKEAGEARPVQNVENTFKIVGEMIQFLHGRITAEQLASVEKECSDEPELPMELPAPEPSEE